MIFFFFFLIMVHKNYNVVNIQIIMSGQRDITQRNYNLQGIIMGIQRKY